MPTSSPKRVDRRFGRRWGLSFCGWLPLFLAEMPLFSKKQKVFFKKAKKHLTNAVRCAIISYGLRKTTMRVWRNWQTRKIQVLMIARLCRFKSCHPHQNKKQPFGLLFVLVCLSAPSLSAKQSRWATERSEEVPHRGACHHGLSALRDTPSWLLFFWSVCRRRACLRSRAGRRPSEARKCRVAAPVTTVLP